MSKLAIVNAPMGFSMIWSFMRPWLAKETVEKVDILGSNYKSVLLDLVDPENLPESLGGTCTCDGLGGCRMSNAGPWMNNRSARRERWLKGEGPLVETDEQPQLQTDGSASTTQESSTSVSTSVSTSASVSTPFTTPNSTNSTSASGSSMSMMTAQSSFSDSESDPSDSTTESSLPPTPPTDHLDVSSVPNDTLKQKTEDLSRGIYTTSV